MTGRANMTGRDPAHQGWFLAPAGYPGQCVESCAEKSINLKKEYICIEVRVNEYYYYMKMHQRYPCNCDKQRRKGRILSSACHYLCTILTLLGRALTCPVALLVCSLWRPFISLCQYLFALTFESPRRYYYYLLLSDG